MNCTRLGVEQSGITGVAIVHHFVVMANNTGDTVSYLVLNHKLKLPYLGGTKFGS